MLKAQSEKRNAFADFVVTAGSKQATVALSYVYNWRLGKKAKWEAGLGARFSGYFGSGKDFTTAPGRLARSTTIPFVIVFAGQETQNWDTLNVQHPFIGSLNLSANFGYRLSRKWALGFNIDLAGFSLGNRSKAILTSNGQQSAEPAARPAPFNVLLTGDNDFGSLNSEFFLRYQLSSRWSLKAVYGFYFAEYKTTTVKQTAPDGTLVDRFRNKANTLGIGFSCHFRR